MKRHPYDHFWPADRPPGRLSKRQRWARRHARIQRWRELAAQGHTPHNERDWHWHWRARHRWHQRWHRHHADFKHSLGARLIAVFVLLAMCSCLILWGASKGLYSPLWAGPMLLAVIGLAYGGIRHLVRPISALAAGAEAFGRGHLNFRVPIWHQDEIGDLAQRFNQMAADIQGMLDGKRALLLAISHELRSPLTRARLHAELVEEGPSKEALLDELAQMRELIAALLESERLGSGHSALQLSACEVGALVRETAPAGVTLEMAPDLPTLRLDRVRVQLLLRNLIQNALRHNDAARGPVVVRAMPEGTTGIRLSVRDHGPGVPPEALGQLGQPFYRPDEARTRTDGGVGLGLSLCRLVAEAHGSRLVMKNVEPGFEVSVVFGSS